MSTTKAWIIGADMGYGHQRAAWTLVKIAKNHTVINACCYAGVPESDNKIWVSITRLYEIISRFKKIPVLGDLVFALFDKFQEIEEFYPRHEGIEPPTLQLKQIYGLMEKKSWGKHLIEQLNEEPLPLVTTFSAVAFMAEYWGYKGEIWLIMTDSDVSRAWAPLHSSKSRINYCVPTSIAKERLLRYGVSSGRIFYTGFPLPEHLVARAKQDLKKRIQALDPSGVYLKRYSDVAKRYLGATPTKPIKPVVPVLTFAVGGAGVQKELGGEIIKSLAGLLREKRIKLFLIAGMHKNIKEYFENELARRDLRSALGRQVVIVFSKNFQEYFSAFHDTLHKTDILWTKPSELVFYAGLGIPVVIAPPIGSQEIQNRKWILRVGAGIDQLDPAASHQWIPDFISQGIFAEAAMQGYVEIEKHGTEHIIGLIAKPS